MDKQAKSKLIVSLISLVIVVIFAYFAFAAPAFQGVGIVNNTDIFYSPYETINFSIVTVGAAPDNATSVQVDLTTINASACGGTGYLNLTNITALNAPAVTWIGGCAVSTFFNYSVANPPIYQIAAGNFSFVAYNSTGGVNITALIGSPVVMQNLGVPPMPPPNCSAPGGKQRFGNLTTNMSLVNDFANVNYIIQIEVNGSCITGPNNGSSPWTGFQQVMMMNFSSLNMTGQGIGQKLQGLKDALQVDITPPHMWGPSRIYVNETAFAELNTNTTITLNNMPFTGLPIIAPDNSSRTTSNVNFVSDTPFDFTIGDGTRHVIVPRGHLTFSVVGFSGYNATDNINPLISINGLTNNNGLNVLINVSVNGTRTPPSLIIISNLSGGNNYMYNATDLTNTANCANITADNEVYQCAFLMNITGTGDGTKTLTVNAWDYGDGQPGNTNSSSSSFILDTTFPIIALTSPTNNSFTTTNNVTFIFNATDANQGSLDCNLFLDQPAGGINMNISSINMSTVVNTSVIHNVANGVHNWTVECFDISGNYNYTQTKFFTVDSIAPNVTLVSPASGTLTSAATKLLNFTVRDNLAMNMNCTLYQDGVSQNNTNVVNASSYSQSIDGGDGIHLWNATCTDNAGNIGASLTWNYTRDTVSPFYSSPTTSAAATYSSTQKYQLNVSWSDTTTLINTAWIIFNGTTYNMNNITSTVYNVTLAPLGVGSYNYSFFANDSLGNINNTANYTLIINRAASVINVMINGTHAGLSIQNGTLNLLLNATVVTGPQGTITLYNNNTIIASGAALAGNLTNFTAPGLYNITATYVDGQNYSSSFETLWINVLAPGNAVVNQSSFIVNATQATVAPSSSNLSTIQNITIPASSNQTVILDLSVALSSGNVTMGTTPTVLARTDNSTAANYTVTIPANTNISGGAAWDGKIEMPTVNSSSFTAPSSGTANLIIDLGSTVQLNFSNPVKIVLGGMAGKHAAWSRGSTALTDILTICNSGNSTNSTAPTVIDAVTTRECYINDGSNLVIWTYHFTSFAAYTPAATPTPSSSSSSSGGGGAITPTVSWSNTYVEDDKEFSEKQTITKSMAENEAVRIMVSGATHTVGITSLTSTSAAIQVESTPQLATLNVGDSKEFDVTNDSYYDIKVTLNSITSGKADLTLTSVHDKVLEAAPATTPAATTPSIPAAIKAISTSKTGIIWISAIVIVLIAIIVLVLVRRNTSHAGHRGHN